MLSIKTTKKPTQCLLMCAMTFRLSLASVFFYSVKNSVVAKLTTQRLSHSTCRLSSEMRRLANLRVIADVSEKLPTNNFRVVSANMKAADFFKLHVQ